MARDESLLLTGAVVLAVHQAADRVRARGGYLSTTAIAVAAIEHGIAAAEAAAINDINRRRRKE